MESNHPQPLFDNAIWLAQAPCASVKTALETSKIENIVSEYAYARRFLLSYQGSDDTFNSYRREVERLCQWSWNYRQKPLKTIDRHDMEAYFQFVQNPPKSWVSEKHCQRFTTNEAGQRVPQLDWRPFLIRKSVKQPTGTKKSGTAQATLRAVMAGTSTFFTYLMQENYRHNNPVMLIRQKSQYLQKHQTLRVIRKLSDEQWEQLIKEIWSKCQHDVRYERHLFIFAAFYLLGCRISELADSASHKPLMSDFYADSHGLWWFKTVGKGNKVREVAVSDEMLQYLTRYRRSLGITALPSPSEHIAIIPKVKGQGGIGIRQLRKIVQSGFDLTIDALLEQGEREKADAMRQVTVHWLRHTAISADVQQRPREHVRDDAGHQSVQITDRYIDIDHRARHASARSRRER